MFYEGKGHEFSKLLLLIQLIQQQLLYNKVCYIILLAFLDTNLNIAATVEKKLSPLPMTLTLSCPGNQKKSQYVAGIGISTG